METKYLFASAGYNIIKKSIYQWTEHHSTKLYDYETPNNVKRNETSERN